MVPYITPLIISCTNLVTFKNGGTLVLKTNFEGILSQHQTTPLLVNPLPFAIKPQPLQFCFYRN